MTLSFGSNGVSNLFSGTISGGSLGSLIKLGGGNETLSGSANYTNTTVSGGTLTLIGAAYSGSSSTANKAYSIAAGSVLSLSLSSLNNADNAANSEPPSSSFTGAGTLNIASGWLRRSTNQGSVVTMSMSGGGLISVAQGAGIQNGGWQNITWTSNLASLSLSGTLDLWDGNQVNVDALSGSGVVTSNPGSGGSQTLEIGVNNGSGLFSGTIVNGSRTTALLKTGTGVEELSGISTYTGATTISGGTLELGNALAVQNSPVTDNAGLVFATGNTTYTLGGLTGSGNIALTGLDTNPLGLNVNGASGSVSTYSGVLSGAGSLNVAGVVLVLSNSASNYTGGTTLSNSGGLILGSTALSVLGPSGTIAVPAGATFGVTAGTAAGEFSVPQIATVLSTSGVFAPGAILGLNVVDPSPFAYTNALTGNLGLLKLGGGTLVLNQANTYSGPTTISAGEIVYSTTASLSPTSVITDNVSNGMGFGLASTYTITNSQLIGTGNVSLTSTGGSPVYLKFVNSTTSSPFSGALTGGGGVIISSGTELFTGASTFTGTASSIASGAGLQLGGGASLSGGTITNNGTLAIATNNASVKISDLIAGGGSLAVSAGSVSMTADNTFTGNVLITGGTLNAPSGDNGNATPLGENSGSRTITVNKGGVLYLTTNNVFYGGGQTAGGLPTIVINGGDVFSTRYNAIGNVNLSGGTLDQNATDGTAAANSSYQGYEILGTITVSGSAPSYIANSNGNGAGDHLLAAGTTFNVGQTNSGGPDLIVTAPLVNESGDYGGIGTASALNKTGLGWMVLSGGSNTYTGATTISGGTLEVGNNNSVTAFKTSGVTLSNSAVLAFYSTSALSESGAITGVGSLRQIGAGTVTLTNSANTFTGGTIISNGEISVTPTAIPATGTAISIGTGPITINGGGTLLWNPGSTGLPYTLADTMTLNGGTFVGNDGNSILNGAINVTAASTVASSYTGKNVYLNGVLSGSSPLSFLNADGTQASTTYITNNANTYNGILSALGTSGSNFQLVIAGSTALQYATVNVVGTSPNSNGAQNGGGTLIFATTSTTALSGGYGIGTALGSGTLGGLEGNGSFSLSDANGNGSTALTVGGNNISTTYSGVISGSGSLTKVGSGLMVLGSAQTFIGGMTINGGTVQLNAGSSFPANTLVTVNAGTTLLGNAQDDLYNTGCNLVIKDGTFYQLSAANRSSLNLVTMTGGTITSGATSPDAAGNICINGTVNATSDAAGNPALINATLVGLNAGAGGSIFNVTRGPGAVDLLITSPIIDTTFNPTTPLIKSGSGILELTGSNTYVGGTTVQAGVLQLGSTAATLGAATGALAMSGGTLDLNGHSVGVGVLSGGGTINDVAGGGAVTLTLGNGGGSGTFTGTIQNTSGTISLVKNGVGTEVVTGANNYGGTTTVSGGTLQFSKPAGLYNGTQTSWTAANITAGSLATLAVNVDTSGGFSPTQAGTLFANLTGSSSGLLAGSSFGIDTTNATGAQSFTQSLQDSAAGSVGFTKLGPGVLRLTNASNNYSGPTIVLNGELDLGGANTNAPAGRVTVSSAASGGQSILSLLNANALGTSSNDNYLAPVSLNSTGGAGPIGYGAILQIGATIGLDPNAPTSTSDFSYQVVPAGQTPTAGQISLGSSGNTADVVGFSASAANTATTRTVALYSTSASTTLQTLQFGTYIPGNLVLGSPTSDTMLILANPIDLNSNVVGTNVQFSSIRGSFSAKLPEGEYAGVIGNSGSAAVNVTIGGNGSLLFANSGNSFSAASLQVAGGGLLIGAYDYANNSQTGPLGMGTAALVLGTSATTSGANLSFLTYGPNSKTIGSSPTLSTNRNIVVNALPGGAGGNGMVVLGGYTDDYTAMNGNVTLNGPVTFFAAQSGRVDFTGAISSSGAVAVQIGGTAFTGGTSSNGSSGNGIGLGGLGGNSAGNGTIAFTASNSFSGTTTVATGRLLVNGSLYASSSATSTVTVGNLQATAAATLGGSGIVYGNVNLYNGTTIEGGMAGGPFVLANGLQINNGSGGENVLFQFDSVALRAIRESRSRTAQGCPALAAARKGS